MEFIADSLPTSRRWRKLATTQRALNFILRYKEIMRSWRRNSEKTSLCRVAAEFDRDNRLFNTLADGYHGGIYHAEFR